MTLFILYISILLRIITRMEAAANITVVTNVTESLRPNQAVSEKGIYIQEYDGK